MGLPRIAYTPSGSAGRALDMPEQLSSWAGPQRTAARQVVESQGGVVMVHFEHFENEMELGIDNLPYSETFLDAMTGFWSFACRGGAFSLARDSARTGYSTVRTALAAGGTNLQVVASGSFAAGERIVIESAQDGWQCEAAVASTKDVSSPPSLQLDRTVIYGWAVGDAVRSEHYYPYCMLAQDQDWPLTEQAAGHQLALRLRVRTYSGRVVPVEP